jgi:mannitol-1-phosphate/altronate dehydrogenase
LLSELDRALALGSDVAGSVNRERTRVPVTDAADLKAPETELGQTAKRQLDMPTTLVDRIVSTAAKERLRSFKSRGNPS